MNYTQHPLSAAFPAMSEADYRSLVEDIRAHGQREPAVAIGSQILDGWHRVSACNEIGTTPDIEQYEGNDLREFVLSKNLHRRQLDASQRASAVVAVANWKPHGDQRSAPGADRAKSASDLAKEAHVSPRTIEQAKAAERAGLGEAVRDGKVSAKRAAEIAKLPEKDRKAAIDAPKPKLVPEPEPENFGPDAAEIAALQAQEAADRVMLEKVLSSDEPLANAHGEIKRLNAELAVVKGQRDQYMNKCNELIRQVKAMQRERRAA